MPATTYPGTVTPLRGLEPFFESERDVLFGRDRERDELVRLVTSEGFRAGLLYGEPGVGKTSLLRAGLIPYLRDHGVIALPCDDATAPAASFARAAAEHTGLAPTAGEQPLAFLARLVGQALAGQQYLFTLDEVDRILGEGSDEIIGELSDLFARVVTRSGGRARFLFCCASDRVHTLGALERRTGSLFPPAARYELLRFAPAVAAAVLERTVSLAGLAASREVSLAVAHDLGHELPILPADLQMAALAVSELRIATVDQLRAAGGGSELARAWIGAVARATGNERAGLRLLAELASSYGVGARRADELAARVGVDRAYARAALRTFEDRGLVRAGAAADDVELSHEVLAPRIREIAAPARASARRAYELLGRRAGQRDRLSVRDWIAVRREGILPSTPDEAAVLHRTRRFAVLVGGAVCGAPLVLLVVLYIMMTGRYYVDTAPALRGGGERIVVRAGRPGLSAFDWLPHSPAFGSIVADTGLGRTDVTEGAWRAIADHTLTGDLDGEAYRPALLATLSPARRALLQYAATGDDTHLQALRKGPLDAAARAFLLDGLHTIGRGRGEEVSLLEDILVAGAPAVQTAALAVAASAARRHPGAYRDLLARALATDDASLRRLAVAAVRGLDPDLRRRLYVDAMAREPAEPIRIELVAAASGQIDERPAADVAVALLLDPATPAAPRRRARQALGRAFLAEPDAAARATAALLADEAALAEDRVLGLELLIEHAQPEALAATFEALAPAARSALASRHPEVRAAAVPVFARVSPTAAAELAQLSERVADLDRPMRIGLARGWGELARRREPAAEPALRDLLADATPAVRAVAARSYGHVGRLAQGTLVDLVKKDRLEVAEGAAWGLAHSIDAGGSTSLAIDGIARLWRGKGRARTRALEIFAALARRHPDPVLSYLTAAARSTENAEWRSLGVAGLCHAFAGGSSSAARALRRAAADPTAEVRRLTIQCVLDHIEEGKTARRIAEDLLADREPGIRALAAHVLGTLAGQDGARSREAGKGLAALLGDEDAEVRIVAARGLASLGGDASPATADALRAAFDRTGVSEREKLEILAAGHALGADGLVPLALADDRAPIRIAGVAVALARPAGAAAAVHAVLADEDPRVRRAVVEKLEESAGALDASVLEQSLTLAMSDADPTIAARAARVFARSAPIDRVVARLAAELGASSEAVRARAAAACTGLAARDPAAAVALLEPLLDDPARDVRIALLPGLAVAYATASPPDALATGLAAGERHAVRRHVLAAALAHLAGLDGKRAAAERALEAAARAAPPLARAEATLTLGLLKNNADATAFLAGLL
jgi:hypothetical protein